MRQSGKPKRVAFSDAKRVEPAQLVSRITGAGTKEARDRGGQYEAAKPRYP
jgi:hypothetical protein